VSEPRRAAPDLVIDGAARSATSSLAARLGEHPAIDPGAVKEPNYYSRHHDRGDEWYDGLFQPRLPGVLRMDASVSYTFPQHPDALRRLAVAAPDVRVVYAVREPLTRTQSHYSLYHNYFQIEPSETFGLGLANNPIFAGTSDYAHWLDQLDAHFPRGRVLVVPFSAVIDDDEVALRLVCERFLDIAAPPRAEQVARAFQNQVVTFRSDALRRTSRMLRRSRFYPGVRRWVGPHRLRQVRRLVTREPPKSDQAKMLGTCTAEQKEELGALAERGRRAVTEWLLEQDARTGVPLAEYWQRENAAAVDRSLE